jgi:hypothetical protein
MLIWIQLSKVLMRRTRIRIRNPAQEMRLMVEGPRKANRAFFIVRCVALAWFLLVNARYGSPTILHKLVAAEQGVAITMLAQGPVNSDVRKQIRLVRYQSEKISASYQVQGFGENWLRNGSSTYFSCGFVCCTFRRGTGSRFSYCAYMPFLASVGTTF